VAVADEQGGDAVCWLHELCPTCGAVPSPDSPGRCWRCGTVEAGTADTGTADAAADLPGTEPDTGSSGG
jgi:hypothetical protein